VALRRRGAGGGAGAGVAHPGRLGRSRSRRPGGGRTAGRRRRRGADGGHQPGGLPVVRARAPRPCRGAGPTGAAGRHGRLAHRPGRAGERGSGMTRPDASLRLRRLLTIIPWIVDHQGSTLDDLAGRFGMRVAELERDLELIPFCGLPPYTPDRLIDCEIVDGRVFLRFAEYFARPLSLTPGEGFALLAAGRALLAVPGADPKGSLASALGKLAGVLGAGEGMAIELGPARYLEPLRAAAEASERVEIDYYTFGRDELTTRRIDPRAVFAAAGQWYVDAWCHRAADDRLFRVDRVRGVRPT